MVKYYRSIFYPWRAREKQLNVVFHEAMSRVARKASQVYRGDVFRHISGRDQLDSALRATISSQIYN